jgi:hypothetical protein
MTTWTGNKSNEVATDYLSGTVQKTYSITGIAGDTGGTLTCRGLKILKNAVVSVYAAATGVAETHYISGRTVVVAYVNPAAGHTVRVTVWGKKG